MRLVYSNKGTTSWLIKLILSFSYWVKLYRKWPRGQEITFACIPERNEQTNVHMPNQYRIMYIPGQNRSAEIIILWSHLSGSLWYIILLIYCVKCTWLLDILYVVIGKQPDWKWTFTVLVFKIFAAVYIYFHWTLLWHVLCTFPNEIHCFSSLHGLTFTSDFTKLGSNT